MAQTHWALITLPGCDLIATLCINTNSYILGMGMGQESKYMSRNGIGHLFFLANLEIRDFNFHSGPYHMC